MAYRELTPSYQVVRHKGTAISSAGDAAHGHAFFVTSPARVLGVRFYNAIAGNPTIRVRLWKPDGAGGGTSVASKEKASCAVGEHVVLFDTPYDITQADITNQRETRNYSFWVTAYDTSGTNYTRDLGTAHRLDTDRALWYVVEQHTVYANTTEASYPGLGVNVTGRCCVDPYGYAEATSANTPPYFTLVSPQNGDTGVDPSDPIVIDAIDDEDNLDETQTSLYVNDVVVYANEHAYNGYTVERTAVTDGYRYTITPPRPFAFNSAVEARGTCIDDEGASDTFSLAFTIAGPSAAAGSTACFTGPINTLEESLLSPFSEFIALEQLRQVMLEIVVDTINLDEAIRYIFLTGHVTPISVMLRDLVIPPTNSETNVRLCYRRTYLEIRDLFEPYESLLPSCLMELRSVKLPGEHSKMLERYVDVTDPDTRVPLLCLLLLLGKALETDELVV